MLGLELNFPTVVLALAILALFVLAIHRLIARGLCDSHKYGGKCSGCSGCSAAEKMVKDCERSLKSQR